MNKYTKPAMDIILFEDEDIITTSGFGEGPDENNGDIIVNPFEGFFD